MVKQKIVTGAVYPGRLLPKMANFFASLLVLTCFFGFPCFNTASRSPLKAKASKGSPAQNSSVSLKSHRRWFKESTTDASPDSWNIFGQWFNQSSSKPSGELIHLKSVESVEEFWNFITPADIESVKRVDISLFRPGFEPDFSKFLTHETGYILSYQILPNTSSAPKFSRNKAKKLQDAGLLSPSGTSLTFYHNFDSIISTAMSSVPANGPLFSSEIFGFTLKKQYDMVFIQVFISGESVKSDVADEIIREMVIAAVPEASLGTFRKLKLSNFSHKIVLGTSPRSSPFKKGSPSRIVTIVPTSESESERDEDVKISRAESSSFSQESNDEMESSPLNTFDEHIESENEQAPHESESIEAVEAPLTSKTASSGASIDDIIDGLDYEDEEEEEDDLSAFITTESSPISESISTPSVTVGELELEPKTITETDTKNESAAQVEKSVPKPMPALIPTQSPIEGELFDLIMTASFTIFERSPKFTHAYFEMVLNRLEEKHKKNRNKI